LWVRRRYGGCDAKAKSRGSGHARANPQPQERAPDRDADGVPLVWPDARMPQAVSKRRRIGPAVFGDQLEGAPQHARHEERHSGPVASLWSSLGPTAARKGLVDDHAGGVEIGERVRDADELLRRHVCSRPLQDRQIGLLFLGEATSDTEVRQDAPLPIEEDVGGFHVAVDYAVLMSDLERFQ